MNRQMKLLTTLAGAFMAMALWTPPVALANPESEYSGEMRDAWLDGKIETAFALNRHLNPFRIDTEVENGMVYLDGTVESDVDRDLAGQIALSVEGVKDVENRLEVADVQQSEMKRTTDDLLQKVSDATTTAVVKSKLLANGNTDGLRIDVDTSNNVVTLSGTVETDEARDLAEALAQNTDNVDRVENKLEIMKESKS